MTGNSLYHPKKASEPSWILPGIRPGSLARGPAPLLALAPARPPGGQPGRRRPGSVAGGAGSVAWHGGGASGGQ